jgi:hypothetical protein
MFSGSFNFSTFISMEDTCSVFPCLLLYNVACYFYFIIRFSYKSIVALLLTTLLPVTYFCFWITDVHGEGVQPPCIYARQSCSCNPVILFVVCTSICNSKLAWEIFSKVHYS